MELLSYIFAIIFYVLFFCWCFFKIRNVILIKKSNCKEIYRNMKKDSKKKKFAKYLSRIIIIALIMFAIYLVIGIVVGGIALFMIFITIGGVMYVDTGTDPTFYNNLLSFVGNYFGLFGYLLFIIVYIAFARAIYINIICYKKLNSGNVSNDSEQEQDFN